MTTSFSGGRNFINVKLENAKNNVIPYNNCCSEAKNYTPKQNKNE
jgi:hypothetical protein